MCGGGRDYGVMFSPNGFMVLKALIQALSSSGFLNLQPPSDPKNCIGIPLGFLFVVPLRTLEYSLQ